MTARQSLTASALWETRGYIARPPITGVGAPRAVSNPLTERGLLVTISPRPFRPFTQARRAAQAVVG